MTAYRAPPGAEHQLAVRRGSVVDVFQAAQLIVFVIVMIGFLLALEVALRRAHRRR